MAVFRSTVSAGSTRRSFIQALATFPALGLAGCASERSVRYRTTLEVLTPEGLRTGSSVLAVKAIFHDGLLGDRSWSGSNWGGATAVDLGQRGLLVLVLWKDDNRWQTSALASPGAFDKMHRELWSPGGVDLAAYDRLSKVRGPTEISFEFLPMLVRFRNPNDPATIEYVDPYRLDRSFGPGVKLSRVTVEITDDEVAADIKTQLPWLAGASPVAFVVPSASIYLKDIPLEKRLRNMNFWAEGPQ